MSFTVIKSKMSKFEKSILKTKLDLIYTSVIQTGPAKPYKSTRNLAHLVTVKKLAKVKPIFQSITNDFAPCCTKRTKPPK